MKKLFESKRFKRIFIISIYAILILINVVPLFIFSDKITFPTYSLWPIFMLIIAVVHTVIAYAYRHKTNFLFLRRFIVPLYLMDDNKYTYTPEYQKNFFLMLKIYYGTFPFYLSVMFFSESTAEASFRTIALFLFTQLIFLVMGILGLIKEAKLRKQKRLLEEMERKEQERREELGRWK